MGKKMMSKKTTSKLSLVKLMGTSLILGAVGVAQAAVAQTAQPAEQTVAQPSTQTAAQSSVQPPITVAEARQYEHDSPDVRPLPTLPQAFNRAYYSHLGNFFDSHGIVPSLTFIFGVPNYVENSISQDGRAVDRLYRDALKQQVSSDPVIRTPDLPNPYTGSVLTTPLVITQEAIPPAPPFPPVQRPSYAEPTPSAPQPPAQPRRPVPALW